MTRNILLDHYFRYPLMRVEDFLKLLYQGEFGAAHAMTRSPEQIVKVMEEEAKGIENTDSPLAEIISQKQLRVNLAPFLAAGHSLKTLAEIFAFSGKTTVGEKERFYQKLDTFEELVKSKQIGLSYVTTRSAILKYKQDIYHPRHSTTYKINYKPHYRVVRRDCFDLFPVIEKINSLLHKDTILVAIDGNSGSGKSFYTKVLEQYFAPRCNVFHMDDFFLPDELRTPARLAEIGGNIHYERVIPVLDSIRNGQVARYEAYNCHTKTMSPKSAPIRQINIVEGVYSTHPLLKDHFDVILRLKINSLTQQKRLLKRSGAEMLEKYNQLWIPLENAFFENCNYDCIELCTDDNDLYTD